MRSSAARSTTLGRPSSRGRKTTRAASGGTALSRIWVLGLTQVWTTRQSKGGPLSRCRMITRSSRAFIPPVRSCPIPRSRIEARRRSAEPPPSSGLAELGEKIHCRLHANLRRRVSPGCVNFRVRETKRLKFRERTISVLDFVDHHQLFSIYVLLYSIGLLVWGAGRRLSTAAAARLPRTTAAAF